jgi:hypothetical protein
VPADPPIANADLYYEANGNRIAVFLDGGIHDDELLRKIDEEKRSRLLAKGPPSWPSEPATSMPASRRCGASSSSTGDHRASPDKRVQVIPSGCLGRHAVSIV